MGTVNKTMEKRIWFRLDNKPQFMLHILSVMTCVKFYKIYTFMQFNDKGETRYMQHRVD
jgi:hypothetical protein